MSLRDAFTAIQDGHRLSVEPVASDPDLRALCDGCGWRLAVYTTDSARWEHAAHVADLQIAYLRDNLTQHGEELGMTVETYRSAFAPDDCDYDRVRVASGWMEPRR